MKKTNKIILSLGTVASIVAPVVAVVSCGNQNDVQTGYYTTNANKIVLKLNKVTAKKPDASKTGQNVIYLADILTKFVSAPVDSVVLGFDGGNTEFPKTNVAVIALNKVITEQAAAKKANPKADIRTPLTDAAAAFLAAVSL